MKRRDLCRWLLFSFLCRRRGTVHSCSLAPSFPSCLVSLFSMSRSSLSPSPVLPDHLFAVIWRKKATGNPSLASGCLAITLPRGSWTFTARNARNHCLSLPSFSVCVRVYRRCMCVLLSLSLFLSLLRLLSAFLSFSPFNANDVPDAK